MAKVGHRIHPYIDDEHSNDSNLTVHASSRQFVGFGTEINDWKVIVDIERARAGSGPIKLPVAFTIDELHHQLRNSLIAKLTLPSRIEQHYFIDGEKITSVMAIAPSSVGRPPANIPALLADKWRLQPNECVGKCYLMCSVSPPGGQAVITTAIRVSLVGKMLVVESHRLLLLSISRKWRQNESCRRAPSQNWIDYISPDLGLVAHLQALWDGLDPLRLRSVMRERWEWDHSDPTTMVAYLPEDRETVQIRLKRYFEWKGWQLGYEKTNSFNTPDFGCQQSLRESLSSQEFGSYSDHEDAVICFRLLDRIVLDAVRSFLESRNISTEDLEESRQTIINSGIFIGEGNFAASSVSLGEGSVATTSTNKMNRREYAPTRDKGNRRRR